MPAGVARSSPRCVKGALIRFTSMSSALGCGSREAWPRGIHPPLPLVAFGEAALQSPGDGSRELGEVQLSKCSAATNCTRSENWHYVRRVDDKTASGCPDAACYALYPRIEGGAAGQIGIIWMDDRLGSPLDHLNGWNVWYRRSTNGGSSWTGPSVRVSQFDPARSESRPNGFGFPYGDYQGLDLLGGHAVIVWGEGHNYVGGPSNPGHVIYRSM
jgi:hypothetical protein